MQMPAAQIRQPRMAPDDGQVALIAMVKRHGIFPWEPLPDGLPDIAPPDGDRGQAGQRCAILLGDMRQIADHEKYRDALEW